MNDRYAKIKRVMELICEFCKGHDGFTCTVCRLHQFDSALELVANGITPEDAVSLMESTTADQLRHNQKIYDSEFGLVEV